MKKKWVSLETTKIKLNPEQAVLSCCDAISRVDALGGEHCWIDTCGGTNVDNQLS
ncbi:MAG: hypothetical protein PHP69_05400 [Candidatus Omnitrophica bacterium]|nr:hypothetical protein [Candidatus Omnitrophota bacterium]MDD5080515.1 hypothetical protein [Candidatus Omnitrophota bacterium]